jgi:N-acetyl-anhydromuramyl-L-alanine amidase AmpD
MARNNRLLRRFGAGAATAALALGGLTLSSPQAAAQDWSECLQGSSDTQAVFERAARIGGVPSDVLLGVGYLSSRWNQHAGVPSTSGGYGVMHLSDQAVTPLSRPAKGDSNRGLPERVGTLRVAAKVTGYSADRLKRDHVANICGGAAVLASYQPATTAQQPAAWSKAVARYSGTAAEEEAAEYADMVFDVLRSGASETTDTGDTVTLAARPQAAVDTPAVGSFDGLEPGIDRAECPSTITCEVIEAQYRSTGPSPTQYVNYDLADRENDISIDYLVVHNTECTYDRCIQLVKGEVEPNRFVSWHYTLRSADGHVAQHVANRNVAAHAGNWYFNMHSIGFEHEGFAAQPGRWYTEALYRSSAELATYLAARYDFELDRAHVVGHDQFGTSTYKWDPGPYWDWEHYMKLLGAPIKPDRRGKSSVVTVRPGFADNPQQMTGCYDAGAACPAFGTNFVNLRTAPSHTAPLVGGATTHVSDKYPRAAAGHKFFVADRQGDWLQVWWDGALAWLHNPKQDSAVVPSQGEVVEAAGTTPVTVYARAYPESAAYAGTAVPDQGQPVLEQRNSSLGAIKLQPGQRYVIGDKTVATDYYYAKSIDGSVPDDRTLISGKERYYQVWVGHRVGFVKAEQVRVLPGR